MIHIIMFLLQFTLPMQSQSSSCGLLTGVINSTINANESWYCPISSQVSTDWSAWLPVMFIVTLISFCLAGIIFMVGIGLGSARIRNYGAAEFYEATATAIIVIAFVYVCAVLFGLGPASFVANINPYATAFHLMGSTIASAQNMYASIYYVYFPLAEITSTSVGISGPSDDLVLASSSIERLFAAGAGVITNGLGLITKTLFLDPAAAISQFLVDGIAVLYAEYYLLIFFSVAAIPCFLIPGVIFRALLPTRGLGGVMIAMAIGFYLVMPTLFACVYFFAAPGLITGINVANAQMQSVGISGITITSPQSPAVLALTNSQQALSGFWMLVLFYPTLIIAFVYSFVVQISKLIGGTYRAASRLRSFI